MIVNKQMQKGGKVGPGMEARFRMEPDQEKRKAAYQEIQRIQA